jgi:hypothetical protein
VGFSEEEKENETVTTEYKKANFLLLVDTVELPQLF